MGADDFRDYILGFIYYQCLLGKIYNFPNCIQESQLKAVFQCLDHCPSVLKAHQINERIITRMKEFVEVFVRGVAV